MTEAVVPISGLSAKPKSFSLTGRLLSGMLLPMAGLAVLLGAGGSWAIEESVEAVNDRILSAASRAIADALAVEDGEITLDLPASAFAMMEDAERDNIYYSISYNGRVISGYPDLPRIAQPSSEGVVNFGKATYRDTRIRIASEVRRLPRINGFVTVQVAETMSSRDRVVREMLASLTSLEALLIVLSAVLIPIAVRWGMAPLMRLRAEIDERVASDLTPISQSHVPVELRDFVGAFNGLLGRLDAAVAGMRRFTADASHQMRTPLSILRTHVAVLRKAKPGSEAARTSIEDIDHATSRLQNLVVQLLALARADAATRSAMIMEEIDLVATVREVANEHAAMALKAKVSLQFANSAEKIPVQTHCTLLIELLNNLVENAITYNQRNGSVQIEVAVVEGQPMVAVEDTGPGIPAEDRARVFDRFTRLTPELDRSGTGLGLSIVKALAEAIGVKVALLDTATGVGLRIEVRFPDEFSATGF